MGVKIIERSTSPVWFLPVRETSTASTYKPSPSSGSYGGLQEPIFDDMLGGISFELSFPSQARVQPEATEEDREAVRAYLASLSDEDREWLMMAEQNWRSCWDADDARPIAEL